MNICLFIKVKQSVDSAASRSAANAKDLQKLEAELNRLKVRLQQYD
jgi:hypothetical protein